MLILPPQVPAYMLSQDRRDWRNYSPPQQQHVPPSHAEVQHGPCHYQPAFSRPWPASHPENGELLCYAQVFTDREETRSRLLTVGLGHSCSVSYFKFVNETDLVGV